MRAELTLKAQREMKEKWQLERDAVKLLKVVVAEWDSDPLSVQCFDLRIVKSAREVIARLDKLEPYGF